MRDTFELLSHRSSGFQYVQRPCDGVVDLFGLLRVNHKSGQTSLDSTISHTILLSTGDLSA